MNINENVWVRLTDAGREQFEEDGRPTLDLIRKSDPTYDYDPMTSHLESDGRCRFQLWELMHIFGPACFNGSNRLPFERNEVEFS